MHISQAYRGLLSLLALLWLFFAAPVAALRAQATPAADLDELRALSEADNDSGPVGIVPALRGFNASIGTSSQHDSSNGWSSIVSPNIAFRVNKYFSVDAGVPIYMYIDIYQSIGTTAKPLYAYEPKKGIFGDTSLSFEGDTRAKTIDYNGAFSLGLPSGDTGYGVGAGQVTYNFNNHFERNVAGLTPDIEIGFGDTSSLVDQRILKSYIAVGPMAHFQAGTAVDLPAHMSFEAHAYEELPLAKDLIYSTTGKGKKKVTTSTNIDPVEDNGFIASLDIPLSPHLTMSGFYNRSLRDHDDVGGFSFTLLLKAPPRLVDTPR